MNQEAKKLWVDALRSDRFVQGKMALETISPERQVRNCCLGVACRVAMENGVALAVVPRQVQSTEHLDNTTFVEFNGARTSLPLEVAVWLGVNRPDVVLPTPVDRGNARFTDLVGMNDRGWTFAEIADVIDQQF